MATLNRKPTKPILVEIGDQSVALRYPAGVIEELEEKYEMSILTLVADLTKNGVRVKMLLELIAAGTKHLGMDGELTVDQLRSVLDVGEVYVLLQGVVSAITAGLPQAKPGEVPNAVPAPVLN